jgi:hypothetical protein
VKGDLPNLLLAFPSFDAKYLVPWVAAPVDNPDETTPVATLELAHKLAEERRAALAEWSIDEAALARYSKTIHARVLTPGAQAGELLHVLSPLEHRSGRWDTDPDSALKPRTCPPAIESPCSAPDPAVPPASSTPHGPWSTARAKA